MIHSIALPSNALSTLRTITSGLPLHRILRVRLVITEVGRLTDLNLISGQVIEIVHTLNGLIELQVVWIVADVSAARTTLLHDFARRLRSVACKSLQRYKIAPVAAGSAKVLYRLGCMKEERVVSGCLLHSGFRNKYAAERHQHFLTISQSAALSRAPLSLRSSSLHGAHIEKFHKVIQCSVTVMNMSSWMEKLLRSGESG